MESIPAWVWLAVLVGISALVRYWFARRDPAPWIFVDELIYSDLAKSFAASGTFALREQATTGYGIVYPALISPAYLFFDDVPAAYSAAKAINSVSMSLAAVPVYLLARRLVGRGLALGAALLAVAIPSLVYTATIMTENAFYPLFALFALMLVLALERPTASRQLAALALIVVAFFARAQAVALAPALVSAIVLFALLETRAGGERVLSRGLMRRLAAFWVTWAGLAAGIFTVVLLQLARGHTFGDTLGAYQVIADGQSYSLAEVSRWFLYHVAELDLYLGIVPFAAFLLIAADAFRGAESSRALRAFVAAGVPLVFFLTLVVAVFVARIDIGRIEERNLFYVVVLFIVALVVWVARGLPRPRTLAGVVVLVAVALPGVIPYGDLINESAVSDTFALLPLWGLEERGVLSSHVPALVMLAAILAGALLLLLPRRFALLLPVLVLAYFALAQGPVERRTSRASVGGLYAAIRGVDREWVDEAVPEGATVAAIWAGGSPPTVIWQNEFFNRAVGPVYYVGGPLPGALPEAPLTVDEATGALLDASGRTVRAEYALTDTSLALNGRVVERDPDLGTTLYRIEERLELTQHVVGIYPDTWSGPEVAYVLYDCQGRRLLALLQSGGLVAGGQTVVASIAGREVARAAVPPTAQIVRLLVPLPRTERCDVKFTVSPTAVPAEVEGSADTRELGVHFLGFRLLEA